MTLIVHPGPPTFYENLANMCRAMVQRGISGSEVCKILTLVLQNNAIKVQPPLPQGWRLQPTANGSMVVVAEDSTLYDAGGYYVQLREEAVRQSRGKSPKADPVSNEDQAIEWLAARLNPGDTVKRDIHKAVCVATYRISERTYKNRVWPTARVKAGLPREGKPGRRKEK